MIFYFSGTGNSEYAARKLLQGGEKLISMKDMVRSREFTYEIQEGEPVILVFPVYFGGIPSIVKWFATKLELIGAPLEYMYCVMTYGGMANAADRMITKVLEDNGYFIDGVYDVKMPDNYFLLADVPGEVEERYILSDADERLNEIKEEIARRGDSDLDESFYQSGLKQRLLTKVMYPMYEFGRKTKKFWVDDQCVGCHACEKRCPSRAIQLQDGKPVWVKDRCVFCLGCTRCGAIHYGDADAKHGRYKHPIYRKK